MKISKALKLVLITLLEDKVKVASWGISNIVIKPTIITFNVDGIKFKGLVTVEVTGISYTLKIGEDSYTELNLCNLVEFMDNKIECTTNYLSDLREWFVQQGI